MEHRHLGRTGLQVSAIALGTMTFGVQCDEATSFRILDRAAAGGVDFLDTADCYPIPLDLHTVGRTEQIVGRWLAGKRDRFVVATKGYFPMGPGVNDRGNSRRHLLQALEASLRRLRTDYLDLYQVHAHDPGTPLDETLRALDDAQRAGKVRHYGCSNFLAWELAKAGLAAQALGVEGFVSLQPRYNLLHRDPESDLLPWCRDRGIGVVVFNPLAGGLLTGKHAPGSEPDPEGRFGARLGSTAATYRRRYWRDDALGVVAELKAALGARGRDLTTAAVAWVLAQPGISAAIVGASRPDQLDATLAAAETRLDAEDLALLDDAWYSLPRRRPEPGPVR